MAHARLCYFWCIPGGLLADSIGRYKTIIASGMTYAIGTTIVAVSVINQLQDDLGMAMVRPAG